MREEKDSLVMIMKQGNLIITNCTLIMDALKAIMKNQNDIMKMLQVVISNQSNSTIKEGEQNDGEYATIHPPVDGKKGITETKNS